MQILISRILCVGKIRSRPAPGAYHHQHQQYNKDFGTRPAPEVRFPTPRSFSLRNPQRRSFGKKVRPGEAKTEAELATVQFQKFQKVKKASIACGPTALVLGKSATRGPNTEAELAAVIISKFQKRKNASIACRPTAPVLKNATRGPKQGR